MAANSDGKLSVRCETSVWSLPPEILEKLGMYLNPRLPFKDFMSLGGKMGYTYMRMRNFGMQDNPTTALLEDWWTENDKQGSIKTVSSLIEMLSAMKRDDAVDLLAPYIYTEVPVCSDKPATQKSRQSTSPFGAYSQKDVQETKPGVENDFIIANTTNLPYNSTPEDAIAIGAQNRIEHSISPHSRQSALASTRQAVGRHPATPDHTNRLANQAPMQRHNDMHSNGMSAEITTKTRTHISATEIQDPPMEDATSLRLPVVSDKVALVIGNQDYMCEKLQGLYYPMTDAVDVAKALWELGFKVVSLVNLTLSEMRIAVQSFCRLLGKGVYAVLYYGGHGYEDGGENFLLPIDANLKYHRQDSLCAQEILQSMQACSTALNLLIIDSCRIRLPERGNRPTYVKRLPRSNNIFAYSCCSQQEAYEEPNQRNGLYAHHLLQHIKRNVRIEQLLMDVAAGVSLSNRVNQRPCHESDAVLDCRLTDPIQPGALPQEYRERVELWQKAHTLPEACRVLENNGLIIDFNLKALFSNVLEVMMVAYNTTDQPMNRFVMDLIVPTPVQTDVRMLSGDTLLPRSVLRQVVRLSALQKLQGRLVASMKVFYDRDDETASCNLEKKVDLGCPLVSSVFTEWDWWVTCGRLPPSKSTEV